jgi:hypothetical protein
MHGIILGPWVNNLISIEGFRPILQRLGKSKLSDLLKGDSFGANPEQIWLKSTSPSASRSRSGASIAVAALNFVP